MPEIISNTSCLIILDNIERLDILQKLYHTIHLTEEVAQEFGKPLATWMTINDVQDKNYLRLLNASVDLAGSRYFCESFYGHPCPTSGKNHATAIASGCPSRPASFAGHPTRGARHHSRNDSTRCRKACIFTTQKTLRENTCTIASGDYSTPVSQRRPGSSFSVSDLGIASLYKNQDMVIP